MEIVFANPRATVPGYAGLKASSTSFDVVDLNVRSWHKADMAADDPEFRF